MSIMKKSFFTNIFLLSFCTALLSACGGSDSSKGILIEGSLSQGSKSSHKVFKHSAGEHISQIEICALGKCSTTDAEGQWGFVINTNFPGGEIAFKLTGHGIETSTVVNIPIAEENVLINFSNEAGTVVVEEMLIDGEDANIEVILEPTTEHTYETEGEHTHS